MSDNHPDWRDHAACKGLTPLFFPERGESTRPAKAVCAGCPVITQCLDDAIINVEKIGIRGGKSERQRRGIRAARSTHGLAVAS